MRDDTRATIIIEFCMPLSWLHEHCHVCLLFTDCSPVWLTTIMFPVLVSSSVCDHFFCRFFNSACHPVLICPSPYLLPVIKLYLSPSYCLFFSSLTLPVIILTARSSAFPFTILTAWYSFTLPQKFLVHVLLIFLSQPWRLVLEFWLLPSLLLYGLFSSSACTQSKLLFSSSARNLFCTQYCLFPGSTCSPPYYCSLDRPANFLPVCFSVLPTDVSSACSGNCNDNF